MEKINLKKAHVIQQMIKDYIRSNTLEPVIRFQPIKSTVPSQIEGETTIKFENDVYNRLTLINTLYHIRMEASKANTNNGIDILLTQVEANKSKINLLKAILNSSKGIEHMSTVRINSKLEELLEQSRNTYGVDNGVATTLISETYAKALEKEIVDLSRQKIEIQDRIQELNFTTYIEVDLDFLRTLGIV